MYADLNGGDEPEGGRVSLRQLRVLIEHLPPTSAYHRAARGHSWTDDTYLLAVIADAVRDHATVTVAANSKNPRSVKRPAPMPRPTDQAEEARKAAEAEAAAEAFRGMVGRLTPDFQHLF
jgi:ADP-ribosylglycohydrolase